METFPRPAGDNGRGLHWVPTTGSSREVVDRYVAEAKRMGVHWMTFLNDGTRLDPANDYLVQQLTAAGIEPVMRVYTPGVGPIAGDLEGLVRHYAALGVHYVQPLNEPNLKVENGGQAPSVARYLDAWLPAAKAIVRGGGLPGFGSLAPGGDVDDLAFLRQALREVRARGEVAALDQAWLSMHNYAGNHPTGGDDGATGVAPLSGFLRYRSYHQALRAELGRDLPLLGTEGGAFAGDQSDPTRPPLDEAAATATMRQVFGFMRDQREPWNLAYSYWTLANEAGGGRDPSFTTHALFRPDGSPTVMASALRTGSLA